MDASEDFSKKIAELSGRLAEGAKNEQLPKMAQELTMLQINVEGLQDDCGKIEQELSGIKNHVTLSESDFAKVEQELTEIKNHMTGVQDGSSKLEQELAEVKNQVTGAQNASSKFEQELVEIKTNITGLQDEVVSSDYVRNLIAETTTKLEAELAQRPSDTSQIQAEVLALQRQMEKSNIDNLEASLYFFTILKNRKQLETD